MKPVIFIPGIEATNLVNANTFGFEMVWNAFDTLGSAIGTRMKGMYIEDKLQLNPLFDETISNIVERQSIASFPYQKSINNIYSRMNAGGKKTDPFYLFGYDWRMSNVENGRRLNLFVTYLKEKLKDEQVESFRFLTHSMGAHVFCCYLNTLSDFSDIGKVVMCAPPFLGSPYAMIHMVKGDGGFKSFLNKIFGRNQDIRKIVRTYPSLYELLPSYDNAISYTDSNKTMTFLTKDFWQSNIYDDIVPLFDSRLENLNQYRWGKMADLSKLPVDVRQRMVILAGSGDDTCTYLKADTQNDKTSNFIRLDMMKNPENNTSGDGTVPLISASYFKESIKTIGIKKESFFDELSNNIDFHGLFLQDSRVQNIVVRFFEANAMAARGLHDNMLHSNRGVNANMWYSIGDSVYSISDKF